MSDVDPTYPGHYNIVSDPFGEDGLCYSLPKWYFVIPITTMRNYAPIVRISSDIAYIGACTDGRILHSSLEMEAFAESGGRLKFGINGFFTTKGRLGANIWNHLVVTYHLDPTDPKQGVIVQINGRHTESAKHDMGTDWPNDDFEFQNTQFDAMYVKNILVEKL